MAKAGPIDASRRIVLLDGMRGLALFGILIANMAIWTGVYFMPPEQAHSVNDPAVLAVGDFLLEWLVVGKFYGLFSLLFGIGFAMQIDRLQQKGEGVGRYVRRLFVLLAIGLAHLLLLWTGDILTLYALVGFVLLLFRRVSDRALIGWAIACWLVTLPWAAYQAYTGYSVWSWGWPWAVSVAQVFDAELITTDMMGVYLSSDPSLHLRAHPSEAVMRMVDLVRQMRFTKVLGLFLLGLWIGRRAIAAAPEAHRHFLSQVMKWGYVVGLPAAALSVAAYHGHILDGTPDGAMVRAVGYALGVPALTLAYAATIARLWADGKRRFISLFAPAGRMALTNYVGQTLINSALFLGIGLGWMGRTPYWAILPLSILVFAGQTLFSRWWLARYRYGPLEWAWRSLTYGKAQPMRLAFTSPASA